MLYQKEFALFQSFIASRDYLFRQAKIENAKLKLVLTLNDWGWLCSVT
jgi:hypothetical protein